MTPSPSRAFSLIELLVTVAIISILIALLTVGFNGARERANASRCTANLRSIHTAILSYVSDNDGYLPPVNPNNAGRGSWMAEIIPYISNYPADLSSLNSISKIMFCPTQVQRIKSSYGYTSLHSYAMNFSLGPNFSPAVQRKRSLASLPQPAATIMVTEAAYNSTSSILTTMPSYLVKAATFRDTYVEGVHNGASNILWCDGHVSAFADVKQLNPSGSDSNSGIGGSKDLHWSPQYDSSNW